ncbi:phosphate ABC transporter membrane protein 2, PhoT family [Natronoarchaeum philippinense]|uniref:Phosphate transport system permease protein PstA n=1 Tax=Natronoarchaeum philippinense TaxID=558529 RepID=A0A285N3P7_NATPI|nr:phosphate ABC transporter permease PstA [Natronoarchaeum philippinense]SNZ04085.1 phosphate ABC transporter membrane protein 2, PhoT family [Natronoarchaeum philippinense]
MSGEATNRTAAPALGAFDRVALGIVGLSIMTFLLGWTTLFQRTSPDTAVAGLSLFTLFGAVFLLAGAGLISAGLASYVGIFETTADQYTGIGTGVGFGVLGFAVGGLVTTIAFGVGATGSVAVGLGVALVTVGVVAVLPEDLGTTLPVGLLSLAWGALLVTGIVDASWFWNPPSLEATFYAPIVVPLATIALSLLVAWSGAIVSEGFGSQGRQNGAYLLIGLNAFGMIAVLLLLILFVVRKGLPKLLEGAQLGPGLSISVPFVTKGVMLGQQFNGIFPAIVGTVWLVIGAVVLAVPMGIGAAVFLTEYAEQGRFTAVIETATNALWSTPSIVYGLFGYAFLVPRFGNSNSLLAGMFVLGFMLLPLVVITSRESLKSVPDEYRDASAALGVNQWQTIRSVVLPAAMPGVITGVILGVGRIAGETAPILLVTSGQPFPARAPSILGSFRFVATPPFVQNEALLQASSALPYQLYAVITAGVGQEEAFGWGTALVLLMVVLGFYAIGIASRIYFRRKLHQ